MVESDAKSTESRVRGRMGFLAVAVLWWVMGTAALAGEVRVAAASNFLGPLKQLAGVFQERTGHRVEAVSGSTGKLFTQILHGAPFDVFLAADSRRPRLLEEQGHAVAGTRFTYAAGRLTLWSPSPQGLRGGGPATLRRGRFDHLAIANPKTAPYGKAARETLERLGVWRKVRSRIVQGENIGQAFQFVASGNAGLGFVALSQVLNPRFAGKGSRWDVPPGFHAPIEQDAVLLPRGKANPAARAWMEFLESPPAKRIIERLGYGLPGSGR